MEQLGLELRYLLAFLMVPRLQVCATAASPPSRCESLSHDAPDEGSGSVCKCQNMDKDRRVYLQLAFHCYLSCFISVLGTEAQSLFIPGKYSTTELYCQSTETERFFLNVWNCKYGRALGRAK